MSKHHVWSILALLVLMALFASGCGAAATPPTPAPVQAPAPTEASSKPTTVAAPSQLNIAAIFISPVEEPWNTSWLQTIERLKAEQPHGLTINLDYTENVAPPDAERVLREYGKTGKYQIIWAHSSYSEAVKNLKDEFPEISWVYAGSGNEPLGGNAYWVDVFIHEPAYLMGIIAGMMTGSNMIGTVASYPYPNVNLPLNAYTAGAKSVNPRVKVKVTYIESWFDPPKAKESATAQIAAGADLIYAERFGPFEAAIEKKVHAFGHFVDQNSLAPETVVTSAVALWDPATTYVIDAWWDHATKGTPYNAPTERIVYLMKDGGSNIAPFYGLESEISEDVKEAVEKARADILAGTLKVPMNEAPATSD